MTVTLEEKAGALYLPIPPDVAAAAGLKAGVELTLTPSVGGVTASRSRIRRIPLKDLLANIRPEQLHGEWDVGPPVGREVW